MPRSQARLVVGPVIKSLFWVLPQSLKSSWITTLRPMTTTCVFVADRLALFRSSLFEGLGTRSHKEKSIASESPRSIMMRYNDTSRTDKSHH